MNYKVFVYIGKCDMMLVHKRTKSNLCDSDKNLRRYSLYEKISYKI